MESATAILASGSRFEDRYELLGTLGVGSLGRADQARQLSTGQPLVIKILAPREGTEESSGRAGGRFRRKTRIAEKGAAVQLLTVAIPAWLRGHRLGELLEASAAREAGKRDVAVEALVGVESGGA